MQHRQRFPYLDGALHVHIEEDVVHAAVEGLFAGQRFNEAVFYGDAKADHLRLLHRAGVRVFFDPPPEALAGLRRAYIPPALGPCGEAFHLLQNEAARKYRGIGQYIGAVCAGSVLDFPRERGGLFQCEYGLARPLCMLYPVVGAQHIVCRAAEIFRGLRGAGRRAEQNENNCRDKFFHIRTSVFCLV